MKVPSEVEATRILWLTENYPPIQGGMSESCARQIREFRKFGIEIDTIAFIYSRKRCLIDIVERDCGRDIFITDSGHAGEGAQRIWKYIQNENLRRPFSAIVGFGAGRPGHLATTFSKWLGIPTFLSVQGNDFDRDWFDSKNGWQVKEALLGAQIVGCVSRELAERVSCLFPELDVRVTPRGIDVSRWELLPSDSRKAKEIRNESIFENRKILGLFGEMKFKKQIWEWLASVRKAGLLNKMGLLIVGWVDEETSQILEDPKLSPPNKKIKFCSAEDLPALYSACDYIVLPSLFEGMPNVLLEAMALGIPAIASDAGAMAEVVVDGKNGFIFQAGDMLAAAKVTAKALNLGDSERSKMGILAREHIKKNYSVKREFEILKAILLSEFPGLKRTGRKKTS
ncbi:MAG: glycosyltransferase family 4 protein [Candidatus Riflebacteria bacterium]|nr:glycosyltransferase family 4 protein [Candidatus Riflebacteria bacterium]